ncbi:hypothetical protein LCGC14_1704850 [marine sediment metagenome]|uniref:Uncharacterized protein n=1 Tax=marine sediment metagenome TaxID=412755 RepID=A0A0F9KH19_9ZZZZ|nr:hypothetical protein [bacterium]
MSIEIKLKIEEKIKELNALKGLVKKRGPPFKGKERLDQHVAFILTVSQRVRLMSILREKKIPLSVLIRKILFGDKKNE